MTFPFFRHPLRRARLRRWWVGGNLFLSGFFAVLIWGMLNHISAGHYLRAHWTHAPEARLSDRTLALLREPGDPVRVFALMRPGNPAYERTKGLLREFAASGPRVAAEMLHPDADIARAEELSRLYRLADEECLVVACGDAFRVVPAAALWEPEGDGGAMAFRGEALLTEALLGMAQATRPAVYFTQGHGERSPEDFDRRTGFSRVAARMREVNLDVACVNLLETQAVPADCALLVVAAPRRTFLPFELSLLRDYLDRKGRLLLLLDARTESGLEPLLLEWGVQIGGDIVVDGSRTLGGRELYVTAYPDHPVVNPLKGFATVFFLPRSVRPVELPPAADRPTVQELASSSGDGWAEFSPDETPARFDETIDIRGPVPVAVAVERGPVPGVRIQIRPTRLIVVGDSNFAANGGLLAGNADFFLNAVNWLLERESLIGTTPQGTGQVAVVMDAEQLRTLFWVLVVGFPVLVTGLGWIVAWMRRREI
jgi:hypothetical protein